MCTSSTRRVCGLYLLAFREHSSGYDSYCGLSDLFYSLLNILHITVATQVPLISRTGTLPHDLQLMSLGRKDGLT